MADVVNHSCGFIKMSATTKPIRYHLLRNVECVKSNTGAQNKLYNLRISFY